MRILLKFLILIFFSTLLISCKEDSTTGPGGTNDAAKAFNYTVSTIALGAFSKISQGDADNIFVAGNPSFRINRGVLTQIDFLDPSFVAYDVSALDSNYAIFVGDISGNETPIIKIYNAGVISTYYLFASAERMTALYAYEKGSFFLGHTTQNAFYKFENETFTNYTIPNASTPVLFGRVGGKFYTITNDFTNAARIIYRIDGANLIQIRAESNAGTVYYVQNDFVRLQTTGPATHTFTYFTETAWAALFTYNAASKYEFVNSLTGESRNFMAIFVLDIGAYKMHVWNSGSLTKQTNFPTGITGSLTGGDNKITDYKNRTFHYLYGNGTKLMKATLAQ